MTHTQPTSELKAILPPKEEVLILLQENNFDVSEIDHYQELAAFTGWFIAAVRFDLSYERLIANKIKNQYLTLEEKRWVLFLIHAFLNSPVMTLSWSKRIRKIMTYV